MFHLELMNFLQLILNSYKQANIPPSDCEHPRWWSCKLSYKFVRRDFVQSLKCKKPILEELLVKVVSVPCVTGQPVNTTLRQNT